MHAQRRPFLQQALAKVNRRDDRTSSVFCLNARPSTPMVLSFNTQSVSLIFLTEAFHLLRR
jgi:hypothetical protein